MIFSLSCIQFRAHPESYSFGSRVRHEHNPHWCIRLGLTSPSHLLATPSSKRTWSPVGFPSALRWGFLGCPRRLPRSLGSDRISGSCGGKLAHPRIAPVPLGSPSDPRERFLGYPRGFPRFKRGLFCIRDEPRASERPANPRDSPYIVRARHVSRRTVALRSARSGRRKPVASATLGGGRLMRRASLPCWTSRGAQTELGAA